MLDAFLLGGVLLVLALALQWAFGEWLSHQVLDASGARWARYRMGHRLLQSLLLLLGPFLYFAFFEALPPQATPGKLVFGCRVRRPDGRRAGVLRVAVRTAFKPLSLLPCGLGLLLAAVGDKRAIHDYLSGCTVVRRGLPSPH